MDVRGLVASGWEHGDALRLIVPDQETVAGEHLHAAGTGEFARAFTFPPDRAVVAQVGVQCDDTGLLGVDDVDAALGVGDHVPHIGEKDIVAGNRLQKRFTRRTVGPGARVLRDPGGVPRAIVAGARGGEPSREDEESSANVRHFSQPPALYG